MGPTASEAESPRRRDRPADIAHTRRAHGLLSVLAFILVAPIAFVAIRQLWDGIKRTVIYGVGDGGASVQIVATTPWTVLLTQVGLAAFVGLVVGAELLVYGARRQLLPDGWWPGNPLGRTTRRVLALVGFALFPAGTVVGFQVVAPVAAGVVTAAGAPVSVVQLVTLLLLVAIATGLTVQAAYVAGVLVLARVRPTSGADHGGR